MATFPELRERLRYRFTEVPGVSDPDLDAWLTEALYLYGYSPTTVEQVPEKETPLVVTLATIQGARAISMRVAHFFKYTDAEEGVDKTKIADNWRNLANDLQNQYEKETDLVENGGGKRRDAYAFKFAKRIDRPDPRRWPYR